MVELIDSPKLLVSECKSWCADSCRELINKSLFDHSLWMLYAGLFIIFIYYIFRNNITNNELIKTNLRKFNYNIDRVERNLHWILFMGIAMILAFIIRILFYTNTIQPLG